MISEQNIAALIGTDVIDSDGDRIGNVGQIYVDPATGRPTWATVKTGFFGLSESFVPLEQADQVDGDIRVPYTKATVKDAPNIDPDAELSDEEQDRLYDYYQGTGTGGYADGTGIGTTGAGTSQNYTSASEGYDTSGPTTDDAMTRSEERLRVGTERVETGRARLRKYVVTENQSVTVPVTREEVRVEREPITDQNVDSALSGPDLSEEEHEVVLTEERPVVQKETVPVERVRLGTEAVTDTEQVDEQVRREEIELQDDGSRQNR